MDIMAMFWYSGEYAAQSKQDAAQTALRFLTWREGAFATNTVNHYQ
jgi:hypothetical protein